MTPTDPTPDDLDVDELAVHAVLDGEATADERRRVARDPRLVARLEALRATAAAIGTAPPPVSEDALAELRARALGTLDAGAAGDEAPPPVDPGAAPDDDEVPPASPAPVTPIAARRSTRSLPPFPAVAAVVLLLVAVGVALVASGLSGGDEDSASQNDATASADAGGSARANEESDAPTAEAAPSTTGADAAAGGDAEDAFDGGAVVVFPDDDALRVVLQDIDPRTLDGLAPDATTSAPPADEPSDLEAAASRCGAVLEASDAAIGPVQAAALVEVDGVAVVVLATPVAATERAAASTRLTALEVASCVPRVAVQRDP